MFSALSSLASKSGLQNTKTCQWVTWLPADANTVDVAQAKWLQLGHVGDGPMGRWADAEQVVISQRNQKYWRKL